MAVYMYLLIYLLFCLMVIQCNKVEAVSAVQGSSVQLKCPFGAVIHGRILWYKMVDIKIFYTDTTFINPKLPEELRSRLNITGDHSVGEYHLSIYNVRKYDEGTYQCEFASINTHRLQLTVITHLPTSVSIENVGLYKKLNATEGLNLIIRCSAVGGDPAPDVKLFISESVVTVAKSSAQFTLPSVNRSYDGQNVTCLAGYKDISYYPLYESARIHLKLSPYPPSFSTDSVITEGTKPLVISCTSVGSRPMALIYWLIGNFKTNVTNSSQSSHSHDPTTDTYSVTSTITYSVDRIYNGQYLICGVSNEALSDHGGSVETSKALNVTYAPDITVTSHQYEQSDAIRLVTCNPSGNPNIYLYHKWQHKSKYGELIREFDGTKTLQLPDMAVLNRYQDSGEYACTVSNGIKDKYNKSEQTGSRYIIVNAQSVFTTDTIDMVKQFGEIDKAVDIYANVYSVPPLISFTWIRDRKAITTQNSAKYASSSSPTIVMDTIHGKKVQLDGYNVTLTIRDLKAEDFTNYTVTLINAFGGVKHTITLEITGVPEPPGNFSIIATSTTSITIVWDPNSGGGHAQAFYIQYRIQGFFSWTTVSAGETGINEQKRPRTYYEVKHLQENKPYELRMFSENTAGKRSNYTNVMIVFTQTSETPTSIIVIGGVVGAVVTLVMIVCASIMGIVFLKRRKGLDQKKKNDKSYENTGFKKKQTEEYEEVGNKCEKGQTKSSKTYESLGIIDRPNVYDDVENPKDQTTHLKKQPTKRNMQKASNCPKENLDYSTTQGSIENLYDNERF